MFWQAGRNVLTGAPLYHDLLPGARPFLYPPFAAMAFAVLAVLPLPLAAGIFSFLNLSLIPLTASLSRRIVARVSPDRPPTRLALLLAVVLSLQFFLNNFNLVQVNALIFLLILVGIDAHLRGHDLVAAGSVVAAAAIKITPVFFAV